MPLKATPYAANIPSQIPKAQNALVATGPGTLAYKRVAIPQLAPNQVLVKTAAVALNPSDHKLIDQSTTVNAISGSDFAGTVVKLGSEVSNLHIGDRVFGAVFGANPAKPTNGAFASYVAATADLCLQVPQGMGFAPAASLGMGIMTVGLVFRELALEFDPARNLQDPKSDNNDGPYVLVYGGATATGTLTLQFLRLAGYRPITTCSPANSALVTARGALAAFDYTSPTCGQQIYSYTNGTLAHVIDCIGNAATMTICYTALGEDGGRYVALEQYPRRLSIRRRNVRHSWVLGWTLFGMEVKLAGAYAREAAPQDLIYGKEWMKKVQLVLGGKTSAGKDPRDTAIQPHPLEVHKRGGLAAVIPKLDSLRRGEVRGKKVVFLL